MKPNHSATGRLRGLAIIAAIVAASTTAAACGAFRHRGAGGSSPVVLYFTNESLDQADVYVATPGNQPVRIGTVFAGRTDTLVVPGDIAARGDNVNIVARLLARSAAPSSGPIPIRPGDRLEIRLPVDEKLLVVLPPRR